MTQMVEDLGILRCILQILTTYLDHRLHRVTYLRIVIAVPAWLIVIETLVAILCATILSLLE